MNIKSKNRNQLSAPGHDFRCAISKVMPRIDQLVKNKQKQKSIEKALPDVARETLSFDYNKSFYTLISKQDYYATRRAVQKVKYK